MSRWTNARWTNARWTNARWINVRRTNTPPPTRGLTEDGGKWQTVIMMHRVRSPSSIESIGVSSASTPRPPSPRQTRPCLTGHPVGKHNHAVAPL